MSSLNKVTLIGNLGRDPESRKMGNGDEVVSFSIATSESWRDKATGERKEKTQWHNIVIFNEGIAKVAEQYCRKGSKIYVEGQLQTREYTDKDGNKRLSVEVVLQKFRGELRLLSGRDEGGDGERDNSRSSSSERTMEKRPAASGSGRSSAPPIDDDIPF
jgi:single-strand DNA-binding protein